MELGRKGHDGIASARVYARLAAGLLPFCAALVFASQPGTDPEALTPRRPGR